MKKLWQWILFGKIDIYITATAGDGIPAEIEYRDRRNRVVGFWAYGYWDPNYPYRG
jgi:hypothetical protein